MTTEEVIRWIEVNRKTLIYVRKDGQVVIRLYPINGSQPIEADSLTEAVIKAVNLQREGGSIYFLDDLFCS